MLIYVKSKAFSHKTFLLLINPTDTIARARAHILHILYEMATPYHQFRLRFRGVYLRDAYTFEDYKIIDSSVIKMVPMAKGKGAEDVSTIQAPLESFISSENNFTNMFLKGVGLQNDEVQDALLTEVKIFARREKMLEVFRVLLWVQFLAMLLSPTTSYPYAIMWIGVLFAYGFHFCPMYSRLGGFMGSISMSNETYLLTLGAGMMISFLASSLIGVIVLLAVISHGCAEFFAGCSHMNIWSVVFHFGEATFLFATMIVMLLIYRNFKVKVGDLIEHCLIQSKDIFKVLQAAKQGRRYEKRNAAFDLASLVVSGDDIKQKIADADGIKVLMGLAASEDEATQEYATEALAELFTIDSIQAQFIELGGARVLCALLHSKSERLLNEAVMAISYIVTNCDAHRHAIVADSGISDLARAVATVSEPCQKVVAGIFLELAFSPDIRSSLASNEEALDAIVLLCEANNKGSKQFALQTLELLAIENADHITSKDNVLDSLVAMCQDEVANDNLHLVAGKILVYFAESETACTKLVNHADLKSTLMQFAMSPDVIVQSLAARIIISLVDSTKDRKLVISVGVIEVLSYLHENCVDREAWELSEQAIDILHGATTQDEKEIANLSVDGASTSSRSIVKH